MLQSPLTLAAYVWKGRQAACGHQGLRCGPFDRESVFLERNLRGNIILVGKAHGNKTLPAETATGPVCLRNQMVPEQCTETPGLPWCLHTGWRAALWCLESLLFSAPIDCAETSFPLASVPRNSPQTLISEGGRASASGFSSEEVMITGI